MTIQDLGALGEFLGFFAVAATIGFLALQIRQNSKLLKTSIHQSLRYSSETRRGFVLQGQDVLSAIMKSRADKELTPNDLLERTQPGVRRR